VGGGAGLREPSVEPARDALLADARERAEQLLKQADEHARGLIAQAQQDAEELIARARKEGLAAGRAQAAHAAGREQALARWEVLAAQRAAYDELRARVREEVMRLRDEPEYPQLLERLVAAARRDLGDGAQLEVDPPDQGGVRASAGSRRVDYTLTALAEACVQRLGPALEQLWA
jgi:vacuolar-type H+-ATPase subunit E/Vma4